MQLAAVALAFVAGLSDLFSGSIPLFVKMKEEWERYIIGFAAGSVLGVFFFEMLGDIDATHTFMFVALGFFTFYLLSKFVMLHSCQHGECEQEHKAGWVTVLGMGSDNIIDGVGIAVGYAMSPFTGVLIAIAVVMHEIPQGISSGLILKRSGFKKKAIIGFAALQGLLYPIGAALAGFIPVVMHPAVLAFVAGDFLYIGASDLLPDAHEKFNWKVVMCVVLGALAFFLIEAFFKAA
ncbi:Zinc transporter ZupT [Candidatus Gugararchaeum adminiculabundum]|nr:Zinc transporter ZupT [Candidatus Gugararchaeum adminiculabundum]